MPNNPPASPIAVPSRLIQRRGRFWAVHDPDGQLVCMAVYRRGAREVVRRLFGSEPAEERHPAPRPKRREYRVVPETAPRNRANERRNEMKKNEMRQTAMRRKGETNG